MYIRSIKSISFMKQKITPKKTLLMLTLSTLGFGAAAQQSGYFPFQGEQKVQTSLSKLLRLPNGMKLVLPPSVKPAQADHKPTVLTTRLVAMYADTFDGAGYRPSGDSTRFFWSGTRGKDYEPAADELQGVRALTGKLPPKADIELQLPEYEANYDSVHIYTTASSGLRDSLISRTLNTLNSDGLPGTTLILHFVNGSFENENKHTKTYNTSKRISTLINEEWDGASWEKKDKRNYTYNASGKPTEFLSEWWDVGTQTWGNVYREPYTYAGDDLTLIEGQSWDVMGLTWMGYARQIYTYDNGNWTSKVVRLWNTDSINWQNTYRTVYSYDTDGRLVAATEGIWDKNALAWNNQIRTVYEYDASGTLETLISQNWSSGSWQNMGRGIFSYATVGNGSRIQIDVAMWTSSWENLYRYTIDFNDEDRVTSLYTQAWDGTIFATVSGEPRHTFLYESFDDGTTGHNGIAGTSKEAGFRYYPNPAVTQLTVESDEALEAVALLDMTGRIVREESVPAHTRRIHLSTASLAPGIYHLRVRHNGRVETVTVSVQ
jgi:hypothetical protein